MNRKKIALLGLLLILTGVLVLAGCSPRQSEAPATEEVALSEEMEESATDEPVVEEEAVMEDPDTPVSTEPEEEEAVEVPETEVPAAVVPEPVPEPEPAPVPEPTPAPEPEVELSGTLVGGVREINVVASQFDFGPEVITVRQGEEVRLLLTTDDVAHGIGLREFGINERIVAGETTVVTFVADTAGEFTFFCSVPCGAGHGSMTGTLVVI